MAILALLQVAAPFLLITVGEQDLPSSLTGILVATAPIFTFLLAIRLEREARAQGPAIFGVALGIVGVGLLLGIDAGGGTDALIGGGMVVLASLGYALGAFYLRHNLSDAPPIGVVASAMGASALMMAPLAAVSFPSEMPGLDTFGSLFVLGVGGTGIAFVIFYTLIAEVGPTRSSLVAYVAPGFSVIYGVLLLDESFTAATFAGLLLILGGSWLAAEGRAALATQESGHRARSAHTGGSSMNTTTQNHEMTIRRADTGDALALGRLAQMDGTRYGGTPVLVADVDGRIVAALPLDGSRAFADPFVRTAQTVAMLRLRLEQLDAPQARQGVSRALRAVRRRRRYRAPASA